MNFRTKGEILQEMSGEFMEQIVDDRNFMTRLLVKPGSGIIFPEWELIYNGPNYTTEARVLKILETIKRKLPDDLQPLIEVLEETGYSGLAEKLREKIYEKTSRK